MPEKDLESRRVAQRVWRQRRLKRGLCEKCPGRARSGKTQCARCSRAESARKVRYERRHGAVRRYPDGHGYRPRVVQGAPTLSTRPLHCPKCEGCVLDMTIEVKCLNCGWIGWLADAGVAR